MDSRNLAPLRGWDFDTIPSTGLRPWLHSYAASRLERANCNSFTLSYAWGYILTPLRGCICVRLMLDARLLLDEQHRRGIEGQRQLRYIRIVVIFQERHVHSIAVVRHLDDDRDRGSELRKVFGDAVLIRRHAAVRHGGHPHLDIELRGELPERLHARQRRALEVEALEDQAGRIEVGILLQEVDRVAQLVDRERLARVSVDDAVSLHLEPLGRKVLEVRGMGEVHEDLVVKLS